MTFGQGRANYAERAEAVAQSVRCRLLTLKEEWFLDVTAGVPYLQEIMVKPGSLETAKALLKANILGTVGVTGLTKFEVIFDTATREMTVIGTVSNEYGETTNIRITQ